MLGTQIGVSLFKVIWKSFGIFIRRKIDPATAEHHRRVYWGSKKPELRGQSVVKPGHLLIDCTVFKEKSLKEIYQKIEELIHCFLCFIKHMVTLYKHSKLCSECGGRHHTSLHFNTSNSDLQLPVMNALFSLAENYPYRPKVLLSTITVLKHDASGHYHEARALLVGGNQCSFMTEHCDPENIIRRIQFPGNVIWTFGGKKPVEMENWLKITLYVSLFACFRDFRPVDSFYTSYLTSPAVNFTSEQVSREIYPINSYATTSLVVIMFLITDYLLYKPIVMLDAFSSIIMFLLVLEPVTLFKSKISMVFLGLTSASELAYTSYAYAKITDRKLYQKMTGVIRGSNLLGKCVSSTFSQIAISYMHLDYSLLVYLSLMGSIMAFVVTFFFPSVHSSVYFYPESPISATKHKNYKTIDDKSHKVATKLYFEKKSPTPVRVVLNQLFLELRDVCNNPYLLKYGIWFGFATGIYFQVLTYNDVLYLKLNNEDPVNNKLYNGGVDAIAFITGSFSSYYIGFLKVEWQSASNMFFFIGSLLCCTSLCVCYYTSSLNLVYIMYIIYCFIFQSMNVVARSETAKHLKHESFAFIFGVAYFISLVISSALTYLFVQGTIYAMPVNVQFLFYGLINGGLALWYLFSILISK
ncbi:Reduced folate carrier,Major facilitator superfamily domain [Cinara cedri]|uniref:Reduced folate carrier,Major facilitator superfamily domain n=1 Tax=Cinara cedri TaxID=506608 RepID=A0A5E4M128_9HEMI|nr:Reduced folate carrier,Major facilitator superfamily domain [Cinara cedri]